MFKFTNAVATALTVTAEHHEADRARFSTLLESLFYSPKEAAIRRGTRVLVNTVLDPRAWRGEAVPDAAQQ